MSKPNASDFKDLEYRGIPLVVALSAVTLFIGYPIYLCYAWARELNGLTRQPRHSPRLVLILSIVTLGLGAMIYECLFAHELERLFRQQGRADAMPQFATWIIALNVLAFVLCLSGVGLPLGIACGMAATCLVQAEFNKLAVGAPVVVC